MPAKVYTRAEWWDLWRNGRAVVIDDRVMVDQVVGHVTGADKRLASQYGRGAVLFFAEWQKKTCSEQTDHGLDSDRREAGDPYAPADTRRFPVRPPS